MSLKNNKVIELTNIDYLRLCCDRGQFEDEDKIAIEDVLDRLIHQYFQIKLTVQTVDAESIEEYYYDKNAPAVGATVYWSVYKSDYEHNEWELLIDIPSRNTDQAVLFWQTLTGTELNKELLINREEVYQFAGIKT